MGSFNPRAREGRDSERLPGVEGHWMFQSTRPRGARRHTHLLQYIMIPVSIHAPARGATHRARHHSLLNNCFNPRAREGRDVFDVRALVSERLVSIHAPARGATRSRSARKPRLFWFQSTRPRGARRSRWRRFLSRACFNPRAREGRDLVQLLFFAGQDMFQSTRPRGARLIW